MNTKTIKNLLSAKLIIPKTGGRYTLGRIDYNSLMWVKMYYDDMSNKKNPIYKFIRWRLKKKFNNLYDDLCSASIIKPADIRDFVKFYVSIKNTVPCEYIQGTVSTMSINDIEYFSLKVKLSTVKRGEDDVRIEIHHSVVSHPNISISRTIEKGNKESSVTVDRLFLDLDEDSYYRDAWLRICKYIKHVLESEIKDGK